MNRVLSRRTGAAAVCFLLLAGAVGAAASSGITAQELGTVRGDTLYVSLSKVIAAAEAHNEILAASAAMSDAAAAEALGAWRGFLPQLKVGEYWVKTNDALSIFAFKLNQRRVSPRDFDPNLLNNPPEAEQYTTRLQVLQPIFNGGMSWQGKRAANAAAEAAAYDHRRARETIVFQAIQVYHGLALAKAYERVMLAARTSAEGHLRQAQSLVEAEMATEADLLQAQVYLSSVKQKLIEVRNLVAVAGENIKLLCAVQTDLHLAPAGQVALRVDSEPPALPAPRDLAQRSDLLAHKYRADAAGKMVGVARGALLPHLNLSAQRDYFGGDLFGDDARSWTIGLFGTWDIFSGLAHIGELKKARAQQRAAQHLYEFQLRQAQVQATEAWLAVRAAREQVDVASAAVTAAREGLRIVTNQYREGLASMVDLLDTQAAATTAEANLVQALHDYHVGLARLDYTGA